MRWVVFSSLAVYGIPGASALPSGVPGLHRIDSALRLLSLVPIGADFCAREERYQCVVFCHDCSRFNFLALPHSG